MLKVDENIERSIQPFMEFCDGTKVPFGDYDENGEFRLNYDATSRYGYNARPIYGVCEEEIVDGLIYRKRKIFVGEAPHKDENGKWVTYNKVPSFYIGAFGGAFELEREPDIPHIIDIQTDEWRHRSDENDENNRKESMTKERELNQKIVFCSFGTYINGLWHRIQKRFGRISYHKGNHCNLLTWSKYPKQLQWVNHWESKSLYFVRENEEWIWITWFRKDGKWGFKREKRENDHTCCEA